MSYFNKESILRQTIKLSREYSEYHNNHGLKDFSTTPKGLKEREEFEATPESAEIQRRRNILADFLEGLSYKDVQILQTIMYIGRDKDHKPHASFEERFNDKKNSLSWGEKSIEVSQMVGKLPLADYLESGAKILDINI